MKSVSLNSCILLLSVCFSQIEVSHALAQDAEVSAVDLGETTLFYSDDLAGLSEPIVIDLYDEFGYLDTAVVDSFEVDSFGLANIDLSASNSIIGDAYGANTGMNIAVVTVTIVDGPHPRDITEIDYDWDHIKNLDINYLQTGVRFGGGHYCPGNFPATETQGGCTYTFTYTYDPDPRVNDQPYTCTVTVKKDGSDFPVENRPTWDMFPENWTEGQVQAAATQAWNDIKDDLDDDDMGGTHTGTGGGINIEIKWTKKSYMDNGVKKWKICINTAYPKS